jgi:hypothetical protein
MILVAALAALGLARILPEHGVFLWFRLAAATVVLLAPGRYLSRALGLAGAASAFVLSVGLVALMLAFTFAVHGSLTLTLWLVLGAGLVAAPFRPTRITDRFVRGLGAVGLAGVGYGIAVWFVEGLIGGDGLFHLARVRKLDDLGSLSLRAVDEFKDGGLHPGYAFPLWHAWLALIAKLAGVDPTAVMRHESSLLVPLAFMLAYEAGRVVFGSAALAFAVVLAQVGMISLAPPGGGSYTTLEQPGTVTRQLLVPAAIVLFFRFVSQPSWAIALAIGVAAMDTAFVHPTYAIFVALPFGGYVLARWIVRGRDVRPGVGALAAFTVPVLLVFAWLAPIVATTASYTPDAKEKARAFTSYARDLVVHSPSSYHLAPQLVGRTGAMAVAALFLVPLAALAGRRRWSAYVLGGTVVVLALELSSFLFPRFSDLVSLSQSRRAAGFVPFAFAFAGGIAVLARLLGVAVLPAALGAGIALQLVYPGDFGHRLSHGGPAVGTWLALWGGLAGILIATWLARTGRGRFHRTGWVAGAAAFLFAIPVAVYGFSNWDAKPKRDPSALSGGVIGYLRTHVPERAVVFADLEASYRIAAYVPVYVAVAPPTHVADTRANHPATRRRDWLRFLRTGDLSIPRAYGARWLVLRRRETVGPGARLVYRDDRFRVYRLPVS